MFARCAERQLPGRPVGVYLGDRVTDLWPGSFFQHEYRQSKLLTIKEDWIWVDLVDSTERGEVQWAA
jgi:hypothetical protein